MATFREKLFLAIVILIIGGGLIYWAYTYDQKLRHEGLTPTKAFFYVGAGLVVLVGIAGLQGIAYAKGNIFGWLLFDDLFNLILKLAF
jgi:hypothetical protein